MKPITLLVVSKQPIIHYGLIKLLNEKSIPAVVTCTEEFVSVNAKSLTPNIILVTTHNSGRIEHLKFLNALKKIGGLENVIIYDQDPQPWSAIELISTGVKGYISANDEIDELLLCIEAVLQGKNYISPSILRAAQVRLSLKTVRNNSSVVKLSPREKEITNYLIHGIRPCIIAAYLGKKPSTISAIKSNIFRKLSVVNIIDLKKLIIEPTNSKILYPKTI